MAYRMVGSDLDFIQFVTPSTSRPGVEHNVAICKRSGEIVCTCEDAACRKKVGSILDATVPGCKHIDGLHAEYRRLLESEA